MTSAEQARLSALEQAVGELRARQDPQALREALEWTWNPRGLADDLLVQDSAGAPLTRRKTLQFAGGATVADDPANGRTVITSALPPPAASGVGHAIAGGSTLSGTGPQAVPGLACTIEVQDDGTGFGMVLFSYAVAWHAYGNATVKSVNTSWDFRADGAQLFTPTSGVAATVRPQLTVISIGPTYYIHTAPAGQASASTGASTTTAGGLALTLGGGGNPFGAIPASPIMLRVPAGTRTLDVYWLNSGGATDEVAIDAGASAAVPLGV